MDIKRIGVGRLNTDTIGDNSIYPQPGYFTFDSTTVTFDSMVDTFDFDIIPIVPPVIRQYSDKDYSSIDYK